MTSEVHNRSAVGIKGRGWLLVWCLLLLVCFSSDSLLRVAAARGLATNGGVEVKSVIQRLPRLVRGMVERQVEFAEARDFLARARTDGERIQANLALAHLKGDEAFERVCAEMLARYPMAPEVHSAYSKFLLAPPGAAARVSPECYRNYVETLSPRVRLDMWKLALDRFEAVKYPPGKTFEFFKPLFMAPPKYREYGALFVRLADLASRSGLADWEMESMRMVDACERAPHLFDSGD